jgi:succinate dehydrogenase hydrophobic anchor subunit
MAVPSIPVPGSAPREAPLEHARREAGAHDWSWVWQAVSGLAVLGLVTLHMVAQHFVVPEGIRDYAAVVAWLSSPVVVLLEVAFLVTVAWHGLLGLRAVLFDFGLSPRTERRVTRLLAGVWILTVGYGVWLTAVIVGRT